LTKIGYHGRKIVISDIVLIIETIEIEENSIFQSVIIKVIEQRKTNIINQIINSELTEKDCFIQSGYWNDDHFIL